MPFQPGTCECGCGGIAPLATRTNASRAHSKGKPIRFIPRHQRGTRPVYDATEPFLLDGEPCKYLPLTLGYVAIVDADVYESRWNYKWFAAVKETGVYAARNAPQVNGKRSPVIYLHRDIMQTPSGQECDHRHHKTLDNRRSQLRNCDKKGGNCGNVVRHRDNQSGFKGVVHLVKRSLYWSRLHHAGVNYNLGNFKDPKLAALAYDMKATEIFGEFAHLNFPSLKSEITLDAALFA